MSPYYLTHMVSGGTCFNYVVCIVGRRHAVRYESSTGPDWNSPWSLPLAEEYSHWVLELFTFCAVLTQYAIALELRTAYCGLQDANLDLQVIRRHTRRYKLPLLAR